MAKGNHSTPPYQKPTTVSNSNLKANPLQVGKGPVNTNMAGRDISAEFASRKHPTGHSRKC